MPTVRELFHAVSGCILNFSFTGQFAEPYTVGLEVVVDRLCGGIVLIESFRVKNKHKTE